MNPQNPNQFPGQPPQEPQIYGPQQYSPMPVPNSGLQAQPPKSNKKLIIGVVVLLVLLLITIAVAVIMNLQRSSTGINGKITRAYDSPAGLTPGMQTSDVKSGKFKLTGSYITGGNFTREGTFSVEDSHMYFEVVPDDTRVNELMKYLYPRKGSKAVYNAAKHGVSRNQTFDFAAMMGYYYLFDTEGGELSGFIPAVETAKAAAEPSDLYTLTTTCDAALADVKKRTDMSTMNVVFEMTPEGVNKTKAVISFASRQAIDKSIVKFFDSCYDLNHKSASKLKSFVDSKRKDVTESPTFTYWQDDGVNILEVSAPPNDKSFGGGLHFELTELSGKIVKREGVAGSYVERRNQFGLAYSLCRVDPVITTSEAAGYRFIREDPSYTYPSINDTGYYCTTLSVPPQFKSATSVRLKTTAGTDTTASGAAINGLRGFHDLVYEVEKFNISNERYPGPIEFRDIAQSNMGALTSVTQSIFANKSLVYTPAPAECVGTCNDFVLGYVPVADSQIRRTTYKP